MKGLDRIDVWLDLGDAFATDQLQSLDLVRRASLQQGFETRQFLFAGGHDQLSAGPRRDVVFDAEPRHRGPTFDAETGLE